MLMFRLLFVMTLFTFQPLHKVNKGYARQAVVTENTPTHLVYESLYSDNSRTNIHNDWRGNSFFLFFFFLHSYNDVLFLKCGTRIYWQCYLILHSVPFVWCLYIGQHVMCIKHFELNSGSNELLSQKQKNHCPLTLEIIHAEIFIQFH